MHCYRIRPLVFTVLLGLMLGDLSVFSGLRCRKPLDFRLILLNLDLLQPQVIFKLLEFAWSKVSIKTVPQFCHFALKLNFLLKFFKFLTFHLSQGLWNLRLGLIRICFYFQVERWLGWANVIGFELVRYLVEGFVFDWSVIGVFILWQLNLIWIVASC